MHNFLKIVGSALGILVGCIIMATINGELVSFFAELNWVIISIFALFGAAVGVVISAFEKDHGPVNMLKASAISVIFILLISMVITMAMVTLTIMNPDRPDPDLSIGWTDIAYFIRGVLVFGIPAAAGYVLLGKLSKPNPKASD